MILDEFKLDGKVALVTGAGQGLGQAMAMALAEAGANLAGLDRNPSQRTSEAVNALGRHYRPVVCDLRIASAADLREIVAETVQAMGGLDILINNAGIIRRAPALEFSERIGMTS
jgi:2-deoxy-D-gluconate 3-dehydrogenase